MSYFIKEAGFGLTHISSDNWKKLLNYINASLIPEITESKGWIWKGEGVTIYTSNDPISGKFYTGFRPDEVGYTGYIGISGNALQVSKAFVFIKENADFKEFNPYRRDFI